jgi:hypothetical protein
MWRDEGDRLHDQQCTKSAVSGPGDSELEGFGQIKILHLPMCLSEGRGVESPIANYVHRRPP